MKGEAEQDQSIDRRRGLCVTRREVLTAGGAALVGLTLSGDALGGALTGLLGQEVTLPGVTTLAGT